MAQLSLSLLVLCFCTVFATFEARKQVPLLDEDGLKMRNKSAECVFGKQVRELGSQWIPDLGVPIGVLYCMKCECVYIQKKRRRVAKVQCRSIKDECVAPECDEPVLLPGRCCKSCPGDSYNPEIIQDIVPQNVIDEEEKGSKHFAALLTGRSSLVLNKAYKNLAASDINKNNVVATGRFTFHKRNLHYSFYVSDKAVRPRSLQFIDSEGNILEEFNLSRPGGLVNSLYQNATKKVCGVWKRLPRDYRRLLKEKGMFVSLVWGEKHDLSISGQILKYGALSKEVFSSLLEAAPGSNSSAMNGAGGTAIVSISTSVSPSIHIAVIFNGIFSSNEIFEVPINITLYLEDKKFILTENVRVQKPSHELNLVEISTPVSPADLRLLTRGKLLLSISSVSKPAALRLTGNVITKATCEIFQTTLSSSPIEPNPYGSSGLAWLYLNNEGSLVYNVQINNLAEQMPAAITLLDQTNKRRTELEDLTPYFVNGWANGTVDRLSPKVLEPLYSGNLAVNVATQTAPNFIHGKLVAKPVGDARDAPAPILLKRENYTLPPSAVGLAWLLVDNDCHFHYDITLTGLGSNDKKLDLYLELLPMLAPGAPVLTKMLDTFQGNQVEGETIQTLSRDELNRLDTGVGFLKIKDKDSSNTLLSATVTHVDVPQSCRPPYTDNNVPFVLQYDPPAVNLGVAECFHEGKFYKEDAQWTSTTDSCTMCFCQNGVAKCDTMTCPDINCPNSNKIKVPGECCAICLPNNYTQEDRQYHKCTFNGKPYSPGAKFHPFMIPQGFDFCMECTCDPIILEIKCHRQKNERNCCKNCPKPDYSFVGDEVPFSPPNLGHKKEIPSENPEQILNDGGCKNFNNPNKPYKNGAEYHPLIDSLGEYQCVTCKCNEGFQTCKRKHCDKTACERMFRSKRNKTLIPPNSADSCCTKTECRKFRHRSKPHNRPHHHTN